MHTFEHGSVVFNFNGDFSGDVLIRTEHTGFAPVEVPCEAILAFAAEYARRKRIGVLEAADWSDILIGGRR